ncbi:hypothetical protein QBC45DRAFT_390487 [Copromyces sp. CBS 386.78]|nr:hypothetical protein QBC45DRAFT_390487 [Copromyces sp. CBS 386.78]
MKYLPCFQPKWMFRKDQPDDKTFLVSAHCTHCSQTDPNGCWLKWRIGSFEKCKTCAVLSMGKAQYRWGGGQLRRYTPDGLKAHFHRWGGLSLWKGRCRIFTTQMNPSWNRNTNVGMRREAILWKDAIDYMVEVTKQPPEWLTRVLAYLQEDEEEPEIHLRGELCQVVGSKDGKTVFQAIEEFMTRMPLMRDRTHRGNFGELMKKLGDANLVMDFKQEIVTVKKEDDTTHDKKVLYFDIRAGDAA